MDDLRPHICRLTQAIRTPLAGTMFTRIDELFCTTEAIANEEARGWDATGLIQKHLAKLADARHSLELFGLGRLFLLARNRCFARVDGS